MRKTKTIRSFTSLENGHFHFAQVNKDQDFDLWAEKNGKKSASEDGQLLGRAHRLHLRPEAEVKETQPRKRERPIEAASTKSALDQLVASPVMLELFDDLAHILRMVAMGNQQRILGVNDHQILPPRPAPQTSSD